MNPLYAALLLLAVLTVWSAFRFVGQQAWHEFRRFKEYRAKQWLEDREFDTMSDMIQRAYLMDNKYYKQDMDAIQNDLQQIADAVNRSNETVAQLAEATSHAFERLVDLIPWGSAPKPAPSDLDPRLN